MTNDKAGPARIGPGHPHHLTTSEMDHIMGNRTKRNATRPHRTRALNAIDRTRISDAVHRAVCTVTASDGFGHCAMYAWTGATVASVITGHQYMVQAGELLAATGDVNDDGNLYFQYSPTASGYANVGTGYEFHAWFTRRPRSAEAGTAVQHSTTHEFVDLSMRHYQRAIEISGLPFTRTPFPDFFWGPWSHLGNLGVRLTTDPAMTSLMLQYDHAPRQEAARLALKMLSR